MKVVITSKQRPYYGGAATNAYKLTHYLRNNNITTAGIFFNITDCDTDPDNIKGVFRIPHNSKIAKINQDESIVKSYTDKVVEYLNGEPDIVLCFNYYLSIISKNTFPNAKIVYMVCGSPVLTLGKNSCISNNISANKFLKLEHFEQFIDKKFYELERKSLESSDYVLFTHESDLTLNIQKKLYNQYYEENPNNNICISYSDQFSIEDIPETDLNNDTKKYDLIIIASNWDRPVKNKQFYKKIFEQYEELNKIVIGNNGDYYKDIKNTTIVGLVSQEEVFDYLRQSKLLLICSLFEDGPNIVTEALLCKTNVITSKNIKNLKYLNEQFITDDVYDINEWKVKIDNILENSIPVPEVNNKNDNRLVNFLEKIYKYKSN